MSSALRLSDFEKRLAPCPFCGGVAKLVSDGSSQVHYGVKCSDCNAGFDRLKSSELSILEFTYLINKWNARTEHKAKIIDEIPNSEVKYYKETGGLKYE